MGIIFSERCLPTFRLPEHQNDNYLLRKFKILSSYKGESQRQDPMVNHPNLELYSYSHTEPKRDRTNQKYFKRLHSLKVKMNTTV